jgi:hypothetical protein
MRPPTETALHRKVDPHLLAAFAFVHPQRSAGSGVEDFMRQPSEGPTLPAPYFCGFLNLSRHSRHSMTIKRVGQRVSSVADACVRFVLGRQPERPLPLFRNDIVANVTTKNPNCGVHCNCGQISHSGHLPIAFLAATNGLVLLFIIVRRQVWIGRCHCFRPRYSRMPIYHCRVILLGCP